MPETPRAVALTAHAEATIVVALVIYGLHQHANTDDAIGALRQLGYTIAADAFEEARTG